MERLNLAKLSCLAALALSACKPVEDKKFDPGCSQGKVEPNMQLREYQNQDGNAWRLIEKESNANARHATYNFGEFGVYFYIYSGSTTLETIPDETSDDEWINLNYNSSLRTGASFWNRINGKVQRYEPEIKIPVPDIIREVCINNGTIYVSKP